MPQTGLRHGSASSSGADSTRSDRTIRPSTFNTVRNNKAKIRPTDRQRFLDEAEISPGTQKSLNTPVSSRVETAPWDGSDLNSRRTGRRRSSAKNTAHLRKGIAESVMPNSVLGDTFSSFANETCFSEATTSDKGAIDGQYSPTSRDFGDERRPSYAGTIGSDSSNWSRKDQNNKKIFGFFGEDPSGCDVPQAQRSSLHIHPSNLVPDSPESWTRPSFGRQPSYTNSLGREDSIRASPRPSRPRTPLPPSDVTPWAYQDPEDIDHFGDAPVRDKLTQESLRNVGVAHTSRFPFHKHRQQKSNEDPQSSPDLERADTFQDINRTTSSFAMRPSIETKDGPPSSNSSQPPSRDGTNDDTNGASVKDQSRTQKRSFLNRLRHLHHKNDRGPTEHKPLLIKKPSKEIFSATSSDANLTQIGSIDEKAPLQKQTTSSSTATNAMKKEHHPRLPFIAKRGASSELPITKDPNDVRTDISSHDAMWRLDTNLDSMEGIVNSQQQPMLSQTSSNVVHASESDNKKDKHNPSTITGVWDAPDSWAVKKHGDENEEKLHELGENGHHAPSTRSGAPFFMRIYRPDSTFATVSVSVSTTAAELVQILGKKTFPNEDLNKFSIIMRKHETSRQLKPGEHPIALQKSLFIQAGYNQDKDHIEELGREDNTYLCRFNFLPTKMIGYASLEKDPGFNKYSKFSNMDLQGRNLMTIPIALYQKSNEIVVLNLSRNLSLEVPKDFIQSCTSLREIKFTGNETYRLPVSFSLATKLTVLDVSNNCLEELEHAELDKLESLISLKLSNNKIKSIPDNFDSFRSLRILSLSSNSLSELPKCICDITTIVDLDISFNEISSLPHIGGLENLERLWATNNKLSGRPEDTVSNLKNLREIDIRFNLIDNIDVLSRLPQLEHLAAGHNSITAFESFFERLRTLYLNHNPVTRFSFSVPVPTLSTLSLASAKLVQLPDDTFYKLSGLTKLILTKNHFASMPQNLGKLSKLEYLSVAKNSLSALPAEVGRLLELRFLDVRENNMTQLPGELWTCRRLEVLNVSSNCLESFPKAPGQSQLQELELALFNNSPSTPGASSTSEEWDKLGEFGPPSARRPSQASNYPGSTGSSPGTTHRKGSLASLYGQAPRKPSTLTRTITGLNPETISPLTRKESIAQNRATLTFAGSMRQLLLADNRLGDEVFDQLAYLQELRVVNLSYNELYDIPPKVIRRWQYISELYLSGNDLTCLPAEDFEEITQLKVLHINGNKFQVLPAELGKVSKLAILDASSNSLKYNVNNWPYDWNWNWNRNLKYLNLSGNKRLEIKLSSSYTSGRDTQDLADFSSLTNLRCLGLMDVTLMIPTIPDQTEDRRVRTSGSNVGSMAYGISDCLGHNEHLSTIDIVVPRLEGHDDETLIGLFDGLPLANGGSKIVKYLQENFERQFKHELKRKASDETPEDALRRTYLALNKDLGTWANQSYEAKERRGVHVAHRGSLITQTLSHEDLISGCAATVMYLHGMDLYVSNVGNAQAILIQSEGSHRIMTRKHDPADPGERERIREAGGYVSRQGKLNDVLEVSRAFGFTQLVPAINASPDISVIRLQETDEMILLASKELWDYLTPDFAVDLARSERTDLMRASQKLRDLAIAFGASGKITVMLIGVSDLRRRERARFRTHSMSMGPSGLPDEYMAAATRRGKRGRDATVDSRLARLDQEVEAPVGDVSLVFTDIKNSTLLWETYPNAMRSAIRMHNETMRRHLRLIGGYEVKTEGDAFMVAFPTVTSALLWTFTIQSQLLDVQWPQEILGSVNGQEVTDPEGTVLFRGLSVRMGIHWGQPVCETDPVTRRMDYFGPMVNRAARISTVADGGQITVSSDFIAEVQRLLETHIDSDRSNSAGSDDTISDEATSLAVRRELRSLSTHGFEVKDLGEKRLKGLENPEYIYLMYPHSLAGRLTIQQQRAEAEKASTQTTGVRAKDSELTVDLQNVWDLWGVSLRLEMLCSSLENPGSAELKAPETALLERTKERGGEITDPFLVNFVEHQISRIETCITSLTLRNMIRPFKEGMLEQACPMADIFKGLHEQMSELKMLKDSIDVEMAPS